MSAGSEMLVSAMRKRAPVHAERTAARREREDAALRLVDAVPRLKSLRMTFSDLPSDGSEKALTYVRPVVVATAPAYFEVPCMHAPCDGRHDLTAAVMDSLSANKKSFAGQSACDGSVEGASCARTLQYKCEASYRTSSK